MAAAVDDKLWETEDIEDIVALAVGLVI